MAPLPVIANCYRVAFNWSTAGGQNSTNVMHFVTSSPETPTDVANGITDVVVQQMWAPIAGSYVCRSLSITPLDGTSATTEVGLADEDKWHGASPGDSIPASAGIVKLSTGLRGRERRGRVFLGPCGEGVVEDGHVDTIFMADWQSAWTGFVSGLGDFDKQLVVASYKLADTAPVTVALAERVLGTQRRRQSRLRV